jgi:hypothetical protein
VTVDEIIDAGDWGFWVYLCGGRARFTAGRAAPWSYAALLSSASRRQYLGCHNLVPVVHDQAISGTEWQFHCSNAV